MVVTTEMIGQNDPPFEIVNSKILGAWKAHSPKEGQLGFVGQFEYVIRNVAEAQGWSEEDLSETIANAR